MEDLRTVIYLLIIMQNGTTKFNLIYEDSIIPIEISIFKSGNQDHDSIGLEFLRGSSDSEIIINVTGAYNYTETIKVIRC